jgi:hypothetical protein
MIAEDNIPESLINYEDPRGPTARNVTHREYEDFVLSTILIPERCKKAIDYVTNEVIRQETSTQEHAELALERLTHSISLWPTNPPANMCSKILLTYTSFAKDARKEPNNVSLLYNTLSTNLRSILFNELNEEIEQLRKDFSDLQNIAESPKRTRLPEDLSLYTDDNFNTEQKRFMEIYDDFIMEIKQHDKSSQIFIIPHSLELRNLFIFTHEDSGLGLITTVLPLRILPFSLISVYDGKIPETFDSFKIQDSPLRRKHFKRFTSEINYLSMLITGRQTAGRPSTLTHPNGNFREMMRIYKTIDHEEQELISFLLARYVITQ